MKPAATRVITVSVVVAGTLLALLLALQIVPIEAQSGIDLTAEILIEPSVPQPGQVVTITIVVKNQGNLDAATGFYTYLYIDPADSPPTPTTADTYFWYLPGLSAGNTSILKRTYTFSTTGCDHVVYVWVDRDNNVSEGNEANNLVSEPVCVGVTCTADVYEPDNICTAAGWITPGMTQTHTLCPVGDEDWSKFIAIAGMTYTIEATNLGPHADPRLYLYDTCSSLSQFGTGPRIDWLAPASGVYYVQSEHRQSTYGPLANYDLSVSVAGGSGDIYEPDDSCTMARDIPTGGSRQTHRFQSAGDQDWVKFTVNSGDNFAIVADNTGTGVNPLVSLYSSCGQAFGDYVNQSSHIQTTSAMGRTYYAKLVNQEPNTYGPNAHYDLSVTAIPCVADAFEDDNSATASKVVSTTGEVTTHNTCPAGDKDWVRFTAEAGTIYVLQTSNLGIAADTDLYLYDTDGSTELAHNDDYGYVAASRIVWQAPANGTYYARVYQHNPNASGADTHYDLSIIKGRCVPDAYEPDNGPFDAPSLVTNGQLQEHNACADPILSNVSDQDWVRFEAVGGSSYLIQTSGLGPNSDTVLNLYDRDHLTRIGSNDDFGSGRASAISATLPIAGTYYIRITHYNSSYFGSGTDYQLSVAGDVPPTPTPTPTFTPTPTPTPVPTPPPNQVRTLILTNRQRISDLYGTANANALMSKLYELANHDSVQGVVIQVENDASVAAAYSAWTADLLDTGKANAVAGAIRNLEIAFLNSSPHVAYIVIVGNDRVIPYRRVPEGDLSKTEHQYAASVTISTTLRAAIQDNMILTDDYYADKEPTSWQGHELYIPDYAVGRLIEQPDEISAFIDAFLANNTIKTNKALVTGYDFVQDAGNIISTLFKNDNLSTDDTLIGYSWSGDALRAKQLNATPRFDLQSINGHSTHTAAGTPDLKAIQAGEIVTATSDLSGTLIFSVGCHAGLNDPGTLDLAQAFTRKRANYVGNTGYGWGGGGVVYSEALMRNFARELLQGTSTHIGKALATAKQHYYSRARSFGPYDAKILMEATLYGLPMYKITSGGTLEPDDPFPSAGITTTAPSAFGDINVGHLDYGLAGAFGEDTTGDGTSLSLDGWINFSAGEPVQPRFFADVSAPAAGSLHGALFLGGVYSDRAGFDPVIALPYNEYISSTGEPAFSAPGWYPAVPFQVRTSDSLSTTAETLVASLGQYSNDAKTERAYRQMSFAPYYSTSPDTEPAEITHLDGVLDESAGSGLIKVEATDSSGIIRVVVAYTNDEGAWHSQDLMYDAKMRKWTGVISGTAETRFFVQAVDGAGNVALGDNKGRYYSLSPPLPLIQGTGYTLYLPLVLKGG